MLNNPKIQVSITEANQNFSKVAKIVDEEKIVVILKQNKPKYLIIDFEEFSKMEKNNQEEKTWEEVSKKMLEDDNLKKVTIIVVSSITDSPHLAEFPSDEYLPLDDWISKPAEPKVLLDKVSKYLKRFNKQ